MVGLGLLAAILLAALIARFVPLGEAGEMTRERFFRSRPWRFAQTLLFTLLLLGAVWRSAAVQGGPDAVVLTFVILAFLVAMAPLVEKISFPGSGSVDLGKQVKADVEALQQYNSRVQMALAAASRVVTQNLAEILVASRGSTPNTKAINAYLSAATEAVAAFLRPPQSASSDAAGSDGATAAQAPDAEPIRVSAWNKSEDSKFLVFAAGWPQDLCSTLTSVFMQANDQSPAAVTFVTGQVLNYPSAQPEMRPPAPTGVVFNGLLVVPLQAGGATVGVLVVERKCAERFEPSSVAVAKQLAALYAGAFA